MENNPENEQKAERTPLSEKRVRRGPLEICESIRELNSAMYKNYKALSPKLRILVADLFNGSVALRVLLETKIGSHPDYQLAVEQGLEVSKKMKELIENEEFWRVLDTEGYLPLSFAGSKEELKKFLEESAESLSRESLEKLALKRFEMPGEKGN